jgi:hypothetical protein
MSVKIGGELPADLIEEFISTVRDDISDLQCGPTTEAELRNEAGTTIRWDGISNYGLCNDVTAFCQEHNLSYVHHSESTGEYDATIIYWIPGMKEAVSVTSDRDGDTLVEIDKIKPYTDLLLALTKQGEKALPLFTGIDPLQDLVEKGLKNYPAMIKALEKKLQALLPGCPTLPAFTISKE